MSRRLTAALLAVVTLAATRDAAALPDLVPEVFGVELVRENVGPGDVAEGCAGGETGRLLLRFSLRARNLGPDDLVMGDPGCPNCLTNPGATCANPLFLCSISHGHVHFETFARTELLSPDGTLVAEGHKLSFCLEDTECPVQTYECGFQGISAGCADVYYANLPCQYLDLTESALEQGVYTLRVTLDPDALIEEADESNNTASAAVGIDCVGAGTCDPIDSFLCSPVATTRGSPRFSRVAAIDLDGAFGATTVSAMRRRSLCAPAATSGATLIDPDTALVAYATRREPGSESPDPVDALEVVNRFGSVDLDLARPDALAVPSALSPASPPAPPDPAAHALDPLECRRAKPSAGASFPPRLVTLDDALGGAGRSFVVRRPRRLCSPVALSGAPIDNPDHHLLCYDAAPAPGEPRALVRGLLLANAIDAGQVDAKPRFELCLPSMVEPLDGDLCGDASPLALPGEDARDTSFATRSHDDPALSCVPDGLHAHSVWYRLVAPGDGTITVDSFGSGFDTVLAAFAGECGELTEVACDDDTQATQSRIDFPVVAGATYLIELSSYGSSAGGAAKVSASFAP